jgi:hypothetical protein
MPYSHIPAVAPLLFADGKRRRKIYF